MLMLVKKYDATCGGYSFVEIDTINKVYSVGKSTAHIGHGFNWCSGDEWLEIEVKTRKEIDKQVNSIERQGYKKVTSMYQFHNTLFNGLAL